VGWRYSFLIFGGIGILYGILWLLLFKNKPEESKTIGEKEKKYILENRQEPSKVKGTIAFSKIIKSRNVWMTMIQYVCSNFTFYFTLTWMFPFVKEKFGLSPVEAGLYSSIPLIAGAAGNWIGGILVDFLYRIKGIKVSRKVPAIVGFTLAAFGMVMVTLSASSTMAVVFLAIAVFGADMTLSPSWVFCIDIGKENAGAVSGTMNMAGNLGAFITIMAYPYLIEWTGSNVPFFYIAASLSVIAIVMWSFMNPKQILTSNN